MDNKSDRADEIRLSANNLAALTSFENLIRGVCER